MASITGNGSKGHHKFILTVTESATSIPNNTSTVKFTFQIAPIQTSWNWMMWADGISYKIVINGTEYTGTIPDYDGYSTVTLKSGSQTVAHNTDGSKSMAYSLSVTDTTGQTYTSGNASASGTLVLTKIPRYATSVQSLNAKTETAIKINWSSDSTIDYIWYSKDNGSNWTGVDVTDGKSGNYTISGLGTNTTYEIKTRVRRKDSQLTTDSSALSVTTYNYPYCSSAPNFTIGNAMTIGFYNPLGRSIDWQILGADGSVIAGNKTTGTSYKGINGEASVSNLYKSIPNAKSGTYKVKVTYGSNVDTKTGGTYSVRGTEVPTINSFTYKDNNATTVAITGNNQQIVQNYSTLLAQVGSATANKSAGGIAKYVLECNGKSVNGTSSGNFNMGTVNSSSNVDLKLTVTDTRGLSASKTIKVTMLAHKTPTAVVTLERLNNYEDETYLTVDGSVSSVNSKNTMAIKYRYKQSGGDFNGFVTINDRQKCTFSLNKNKVYYFNVVVTDAFGSTFDKNYKLDKGMFPLFIDIEKNSLGVNTFPKREGSIETKGQIFLERDEADTDAIYMAKRTDTGREIGFGVGKSGVYRGVYDYFFEKWILKADDEAVYVNDIKFDNDVFGDSGWKTVTYEGSFAHYNDAQILKYRRIGKQVYIRGAMKPTTELAKDTSHKAFTLPVGYRPAQLQDFLCQGSTTNKWLCEITSAGVVSVARYGTTEHINIPTTAWLPVSISFLVD